MASGVCAIIVTVPATTHADVLVSEAVGLLLEGLGLDDTLGGRESLALVTDIAELGPPADGDTAAIRTELAEHLGLASARSRAREQFITLAHKRGLSTAPATLEAARRSLERTTDTALVAGLAGAPSVVANVPLHEFELEEKRLAKICQDVAAPWAEIEGRLAESALDEVDLTKEAGKLRNNGGWLAFFLPSPEKQARELLAPYLSEELRAAPAMQIAQVVDRAAAYVVARDRLQAQVEASHPWVRWAVDVRTGIADAQRVAALRWLLGEVATGAFGSSEKELLINDGWHSVLSSEVGQSWAAALRTPRPPQRSADLGPSVRSAIERFGDWLADRPPAVPDAEFSDFADELGSALPAITQALLACRLADSDASTARDLRAKVRNDPGSFGPADPNRARFRDVADGFRLGIAAAWQKLEPLQPEHPTVISLVGELRQTLGLMTAELRIQTPARGPLRVAIAGRTKAGKTSLRKVLTRDLSDDGIGRGIHRTTRKAEAFSWDRITFVDTPGVSAKDDEYDADTAMQTCRDADAVVWVFAESLHEEEAEILQAQLTVKPVLVVFNVKERVDTPRYLDMFVRTSDLAFADVDGHAQRSVQMAEAAGVRPPPFVAAHVSAARHALVAEGVTHPAFSISRVPVLEENLSQLLVSQAHGLRSLRLADQVRTPVAAAAQEAAASVDALLPRFRAFEHRVSNEERELRGAASRAVGHGRAQIAKNFKAAERELPTWVATVDGRGDSTDAAWRDFLGRLKVDQTMSSIAGTFAASARTAGLLLDREDQLEEQLQRDQLRAQSRKGIHPLGRLWRILKRIGALVTRNAWRFRAEAQMGPPGWVALAVDVLATSASALTEEVRESQIDRHAWERDADEAARRKLDQVRRRVGKELDRIETAFAERIGEHFAQSRAEITTIGSVLAGLEGFGARAETGIAEIDRLTVERLLQLGGLPPGQVIAVDRVPNRHLRVRVVGEPRKVERCLGAVFDGCTTEEVTVTRGHRRPRKNRRAREKELTS